MSVTVKLKRGEITFPDFNSIEELRASEVVQGREGSVKCLKCGKNMRYWLNQLPMNWSTPDMRFRLIVGCPTCEGQIIIEFFPEDWQYTDESLKETAEEMMREARELQIKIAEGKE